MTLNGHYVHTLKAYASFGAHGKNMNYWNFIAALASCAVSFRWLDSNCIKYVKIMSGNTVERKLAILHNAIADEMCPLWQTAVVTR